MFGQTVCSRYGQQQQGRPARSPSVDSRVQRTARVPGPSPLEEGSGPSQIFNLILGPRSAYFDAFYDPSDERIIYGKF